MNKVHFAIPEIYGETLSYYELLRKLVDKTNYLIENYNTVPEQIDEAVANLDASQLFSEVLNQLIHSIAADNTKSTNAVKVYKKHDLLYATFNETVNLYESLIDFSTGTATELIPGTNIREVNISELFIELRKLIDINKNNIDAVRSVANENSGDITTIHDDITAIENKNTEQDNEISTLRTMISSPYNFKGDVASISALPASGNINDTYYVQDVKYKVTWTGSAWVQSSLSEADYQTELSELKSDLDYKHIRHSYSNGYNIDSFNNTVASGYWGNECVYPKGYVKDIKIKLSSSNDCYIAFLNSGNKVIHKVIKSDCSAGINYINVNNFINEDFKVYINSNKTMRCGNASNLYASKYTTASLDLGKIANLEEYGTFDFSFEVIYDTVGENLIDINKQIFGTKNKMFVFGDSITACYPTYEEELKWQTEVGRALGLEITSGASSGNGYLYSTGSDNAKTIALETDFSLYDYTVSFWGTNDYGNDANLGNIEDISIDGSEHTSFYGAVAYVVRTIFSKNRNITPILVTPLNRTDVGTLNSNYAYGTPNGIGKTLSDYCQAIVDVANFYGIPYIDNRNGTFNRFSCEYLLGDNLHPNEEGYKRLGQWMSAQLSKYVSTYHGMY